MSYNEKHNEANGEGNADGESHNRSWNCGVEGPTDDLEVLALRERQKRNFLTTLFLSQGVPMLLHGDELGRTQGGNNNVYCQDNEISWVDWEDARQNWALTDFTGKLAQLRREHPVFRRRRFFQGDPEPRLGERARRHRLVHPRRRAHERAATGRSATPGRWRCSSTATRSPSRTAAASGSSTTRSCCCSTATTRTWTSPSPARCTASAGRPVLDTAAPVVDDRPTAKAGEPVTLESRSILGAPTGGLSRL